MIVKENGEAVYFSGQISRYLRNPAGSPDLNVVNMAGDGLRIPLRNSLYKAVTARERVVQKQVSVQINSVVSLVDLAVEPLTAFKANLYLIVFEEVAPGPIPQQGEAAASDAGAEETIRHLERELRSSQEQAQSAFEELESSNEELQSANEEFQSTNEELETSKEELQSFNEELETVNNELNNKVAALDHAHSDLRNLFDSTQIATVFLDTALKIRSFTPAAGSLFRLITGDIGRPITDLATQFRGIDLAQDSQEVLRTLSARELQVAGADGRYFQSRILPYRTVQNVIDGVVLTFTDVSQLEQAQRRAEDAKTYAENIISTVREPLVVLDANLRVQTANEAFYDAFNISADETRNVALFQLGNGQWDIPELRRLLNEVLPEKKILEDFQVIIGMKTMLLNARQIHRQNGDAPLILLAVEDITERRRAEKAHAHLAAIITSSSDAIVSTTLEGIITTWNAGAERMYGYTAEEMIGQSLQRLIPPEGRDQEDIFMGRVKAGERIEPYETVRLTKDAHRMPVSLTISAIKDPAGKIIGASKIARDITEPQRIKAELRRLNDDLKHFAYAASHDLREPLRMVTSYTQLLAKQYKGTLDPLAEQAIVYAVEGAKQMELLLKGLRDYWEVNEGKAEQEVLTDSNQILEQVLTLFGSTIQQSGAVITHDPLPTVMAQEIPLTLLFKNLVGNALKYTQPGEPPRIHISAQGSASDWSFSVRDYGIGIEAEHLVKIFAPFKRLHSAQEYPGTGLGLAICQKIVERNRGRIWAESTYGQGSTFYLKIPLKGDK